MFETFDSIVVINLPERVDRRRETEAELERVGIKHARFFAAKRPADRGPFRTIGEHGCSLSHVAVLKEALKARKRSDSGSTFISNRHCNAQVVRWNCAIADDDRWPT